MKDLYWPKNAQQLVEIKKHLNIFRFISFLKSLFRRTAEVFLYSCMMYLTVLAAQVPPTLLRYQWYLGTVFYVIVNLPTLMKMALPVVHDQQRWFHWGVPFFFFWN